MLVLIAEDNPVSAKIIEHTLKKHGYQTLVASNGEKALECLESVLEIELVVTDVLMPQVDGIELVRRMKERPEWRGIPVVMCTSKADLETVKKVAALGCRHYVVKPIRADPLLQKIQHALAQRNAQRDVLENPYKVISQLGIDRQSYAEIARTLLGLLDQKVPLLEKQIKGGGRDPLDFKDLIEGVLLLGAERVARILRLEGSSEQGEVSWEKYPWLLRELKVLRGALHAACQRLGLSLKTEADMEETPASAEA